MLGVNSNPFLPGVTKSKKDLFTDFFQTIVLALVASLVIYLIFLVPSIVDGPSMEPNFMDNDLLFANKTIQWFGSSDFARQRGYDYQRGDVIIFQLENTNLIKRIVAVAGDKIKFIGSDVYLNDKKLTEDYLPGGLETFLPSGFRTFIVEGEEKIVPADSYFVMGDNRPESKDSRYAEVGFIKRDQIKGKVFIRYWPLSEFGLIKRGTYQQN